MALSKEEKIQAKLDDDKYVEKIVKEFYADSEQLTLTFTKIGQPENYVRERYTSRGKRFYNKKQGIMTEMRQEFKDSLLKDELEILGPLLSNKDAVYYVELEMNFYLKIPKGDSIKTTVLKEKGVIRPGIRPDLDNYIKLCADVLHDVCYDDDKRIVKIETNKYYSANPRTEIEVEIEIISNN